MKKEIAAVLVIILGFALIQTLQLGQWGGGRPGPVLQQADDSTFAEEVAESGEWTLVKFWAPWCDACRRLMPTVTSLAEEKREELTVLTVNVDEAPATVQAFGVQPIPCLVLMRNGQEVDRMIGVHPRPVLAAWIEGFMARTASTSL